eukprot:TRINITY_DN25731_c0_g1_i1.p1 TRINITY_DN25731_c0_g1~~TRINITY_DN25731_c0_g1_i1.p1  ORF type:complete len:112 (-),score=22.15 TRINITY_DN25731_c0_g1_i1:25-360(-)
MSQYKVLPPYSEINTINTEDSSFVNFSLSYGSDDTARQGTGGSRPMTLRAWRQWWKCQTQCQKDPHSSPGSRKVSSISSKLSTPNLLSSAINPLLNLFPMAPSGTHHKLLI